MRVRSNCTRKQYKRDKQKVYNFVCISFNQQIFEQTRKCGILSKVVAIEGDILADGLGLSEENRKTLVERVSIVFHSAASVRFDEPLRKAIDINVLGTRRVLELCRDLKSCAAFVHVSTAYCFCNRNYVGEEVYDEKIHYQKVGYLLISIIQTLYRTRFYVCYQYS